MYGIAYVVIPTEFHSLQAVLDEALAPFRRGGVDDFPSDKLAFNDVTETIRRLHREAITLKSDGAGIAVVGGSTMGSDLDFDALREFLLTLCAPTWSGRLADVEPDLDAFSRRFTMWKRRDPYAGGYGQWLNPLGRWDWWELGGRFDGLVSGERRAGAGSESMISSGPNRGRDLLGGVARALGGKPSEIEAEIAANVDLVSSLLDAARRDQVHAFPTAVVLPVGACADEFRWFDSLDWRPIPSATKALLSVPDDATFKETATAAWERFERMAVAGVAYHF
jgi:hypothetical protein